MKNLLFALALLVGTTGAAHAQSLLSRLSFGVKGGGSATGFTGPRVSGISYKPGFMAGAFVGFKITEHISIQEDFLYSQKGAELDNFLLAGHKLDATLGYFDVPFLLRYTFGEGGYGLYAEAGPQGSFLLTQKTTVKDDASGSEIISLGTDKDDFTAIVAGYAGGVGYKFGNGLQVGVRYTGDLLPVYKKDRGYPELYHSVAQVQLSYGFGSKGK